MYLGDTPTKPAGLTCQSYSAQGMRDACENGGAPWFQFKGGPTTTNCALAYATDRNQRLWCEFMHGQGAYAGAGQPSGTTSGGATAPTTTTNKCPPGATRIFIPLLGWTCLAVPTNTPPPATPPPSNTPPPSTTQPVGWCPPGTVRVFQADNSTFCAATSDPAAPTQGGLPATTGGFVPVPAVAPKASDTLFSTEQIRAFLSSTPGKVIAVSLAGAVVWKFLRS